MSEQTSIMIHQDPDSKSTAEYFGAIARAICCNGLQGMLARPEEYCDGSLLKEKACSRVIVDQKNDLCSAPLQWHGIHVGERVFIKEIQEQKVKRKIHGI
jgi:hypothetical protein